jgi:spoIIIJ-associated protein
MKRQGIKEIFMEFEFEGRTEKEAIDRAAGELGLEKDDFDVEILETQKHSLFKKGYVRIRVHVSNSTVAGHGRKSRDSSPGNTGSDDSHRKSYIGKAAFGEPQPQNEFEEKMTEFAAGIIERMGYPCKISILFREKHKLGIKIESDH